VRIGDLGDAKRFGSRLAELLDYHNFLLERRYGEPPVDPGATLAACLAQGERIRPIVCDVAGELGALRARGANVLFEGAQGTMLDVDHGTFPFVTSSNTVAGYAPVGTGLGPRDIDDVLGIVKAYTTRVGEGPFPTELKDAIGDRLGERGREFGTVTGRKRRCGWFDAALVRQAMKVAGVDGVALTKLDVLDGFDELKVCVGYDLGGARLDYLPAGLDAQSAVRPVYETMPGWKGSTVGARSWAELPAEAVKYVRRIEELIERPIALVSTSPERDDVILMRDPFEG
jgi:adenylosuccinate synthase